MSLTVEIQAPLLNGNVGSQSYISGSIGTKCLCCPYGYHIDLDFVRYCEAVAAGSSGSDRVSERRRKRERRRQCQSMEVLLGLVSPALAGIESQLPKIAQESSSTNGITTLPRSSHARPCNVQHSPILDISDVVGDFEDTLRRSSRSSRPSDRHNYTEQIDACVSRPSAQTEGPPDLDNASITSGNSNPSTGALQNVREQMATALERMKDLEEQVKAIPMLQVKVSVLKEEKRHLQQRINEFNRWETENRSTLHRYRSQSFSEDRTPSAPDPKIPTRDMGTMCGVMTRDVGVSHQQIRTRDAGMVTSTPIQQRLENIDQTTASIDDSLLSTPKRNISHMKLERSRLQIESILPSVMGRPEQKLSRSGLKLENIFPELTLRKVLQRSDLRIETINPDYDLIRNKSDMQKENSVISRTNQRKKVLQRGGFYYDEISPKLKEEMLNLNTRSCGTETTLTMKDVKTSEEFTMELDESLRIHKVMNTPKRVQTISVETQCVPEVKPLLKIVEKKDQAVQVSKPLKLTSNVGVTVKPRSSDVGIEAKPGPGTRNTASGPDPVSAQTISLNALGTRSHSFNYGDSKLTRKSTKSIGLTVDGLIKTAARSTDTTGLTPKKREFGTSTLKKKFIDVAVGDSVRSPHISISCSANYCDNCKDTIKTLAKQIVNNTDNINQQNNNQVSRIPRPSYISLSSPTDHRRQFKRQDTYTKIPCSTVIKYDADNKEQYESNNRLQNSETEEVHDEKISSEESSPAGEKSEVEEKHGLPDSALFQPIQEKPRQKVKPSREMGAAMKVLNDNLKKSPSRNISHQIKNATTIIQQEWFKVSSTATANPLDVEDYLDCFEETSSSLLEYIVNMNDASGNTAMHYAVSHGNFDVVSILLDSKVCDINRANVAGYTAVMLAALAEVRNSTHSSVANRLFQLADVNVRAKQHGQTALMLAVSHGRKDMAKLLLDAGAAVNIQDEDGSTALMCAAEHGHTEIVRLLLAHPDCDSSIVDVDGSSALKIALEAGNRDIGVLLYAHEYVNRGISPYSSMRRSRRGSQPTTPTGGPSPSAPVSPAPSRRFHSSTMSLNSTKYLSK
ncbi:KN motif and ankyrin repeat domain-containing protein 2 isoform X1 [Neodiprion pinetum]|uniref:KN motif and ankyrin repeat domain-containing protein 2 isoform X1 n=2 Tax=Neodiprion pinetum TaxID=441929 RepID=UPI001EDF0555|nr:KN motif and ankyrin repeat domain-containing protein 2 isoform X1 [Neodiprion pinetum]XP_046481833.1 KN motif and ankyrin repeat domain-containing protein 2 isoform X1 [Neodiprion pinetum]